MDEQISQSLLALVEAGELKVAFLQKERDEKYKEIVETIHRNWDEIEKLIKDELPPVVQNYFEVSEDFVSPISVYNPRPTSTPDIEYVAKQLPVISIDGRKGELKIPGFDSIEVHITNINGKVQIRYYGGGYEPDGSLEVALYEAKRSYDVDARYNTDS